MLLPVFFSRSDLCPQLMKMPAMMYVYVEDCDATFKTALAAGAVTVLEPDDYPHGDRYGGVKDPVGNIWWIVTHIGKQT